MMKIKYGYVFLIWVICWGSFASNSTEYTNKNMGIEVKVFSTKKTLQPSSVMSIWLEIKNKSDKTYYITDNTLDFFSVLDSHGRKVPYSIKGQIRLDPYPSMTPSMTPLHIEIPAGKTKKIKVITDLLKLINIRKTGKYCFNSTIRLYNNIYIDKKNREKNKFEADILRMPPLVFNFATDKIKDKNDFQKYINIKTVSKAPIYGLIVKQLKINKNVLDGKKHDNTTEVIVDIENVSKDKFPAIQWLGHFDMALWDCKFFHNGKLMKYGLFYGLRLRANFKQVKYHYWYDVIAPGETKSFKLIIKASYFPQDIPKGAKEIDPNGSWSFIFSRKIFFNKNGNYNTCDQDKLSQNVKSIVLPKISITLKNRSKVGIPPPPVNKL